MRIDLVPERDKQLAISNWQLARKGGSGCGLRDTRPPIRPEFKPGSNFVVKTFSCGATCPESARHRENRRRRRWQSPFFVSYSPGSALLVHSPWSRARPLVELSKRFRQIEPLHRQGWRSQSCGACRYDSGGRQFGPKSQRSLHEETVHSSWYRLVIVPYRTLFVKISYR
jgi:hypothetical protein